MRSRGWTRGGVPLKTVAAMGVIAACGGNGVKAAQGALCTQQSLDAAGRPPSPRQL